MEEYEWIRQASELAYLFAKDLSMSREQYMDRLPNFGDQPSNYIGKFDLAVIVQTPTRKLPLARMLEIVGLVSRFNPSKIKDWQGDPTKFKTPTFPYVTWLYDGRVNRNSSVRVVRSSLGSDERGGTVYDGIALLIHYPEVLQGCNLRLPGSQYGSDWVPDLRWEDKLQLGVQHVDNTGDLWNSVWGAVVAGRNIATKTTKRLGF